MSHHVPTTEEAVNARKQQIEGHTESHGHSVAAWTGVGVCTLGALVGAVGVVVISLSSTIGWVMFFVGLVLMAISGLIGMALSRAGYGAKAKGHEGGPQHAGQAIH